MNHQQIKQHYTEYARRLGVEINILKQRGRYYVAGEIASFAAVIGFIVWYTLQASLSWLPLLSVAAFVVYILVRMADGRNDRKKEALENLYTAYEREISYIDGNFSPFDDGKGYADAHHAFTFDLDVFGRDSLFQRINRTVTTGGSRYLAHCLSALPLSLGPDALAAINRRTHAIDELAAMEPWRMQFVSQGVNHPIDSKAIVAALQAVQAMALPKKASSPIALAMACISIAWLFVAIGLSVFGVLPSSVPVTWGIVQLAAVLMVCAQPLARIGQKVEKLHKQMKGYIAIIKLITQNKNFKSEEMKSCLSSLEGATESFSKMEAVLNGLDSRGNVMGLILFNALFLSDLFLLRRFLKWQKLYLSSMEQWVDTVNKIDALVSMATFRYNEPAAATATVVASPNVVYSARGLYHPFLGEKAVKNNFTLADDNYYIVTGANMAGKSTFLRSIGVNYILAMNGMPVFADSLTVSVFSLFSSMRTTDDLAHGISYFNAELIRLKQLVDHCKSHDKTLIILDEILKGTNSLDKLNGSRLFLEYISRQKVTGIIATHDLELSRMAEERPERFHNYCFEIELSKKVTYTYKITPGVARNQNATFLLKQIIGE